MRQENEFYIGWQTTVPRGTARAVRRYVFGVLLFTVVAVVLMVLGQSGFSNGVFEYGKQTELAGILTTVPVPFLTVDNGKNAHGEPVLQKILLVAPGKFGFQPAEAIPAAGRRALVSGFLIYHDGKTALEVNQVQYSGSHVPAWKASGPPPTDQAATVILRGELTDPKCLLGVMKPGAGKPHRECAVRCIAGGIPPVLKTANASGEAEYYLLAGPGGEPLNQYLLDYVGDGIQVFGRLEQLAGWFVLYTDPSTFQRINKGALNAEPMCQ